MHEMIKNFLRSFANSLVTTNRDKDQMIFGVLRLYDDSIKHAPRKTNCVGLGSLVRHLAGEFERLQTEHNLNLSFSENDLRYAVFDSGCRKGTGARPHVVMITPEGAQNLKMIQDAREAENDKAQDLFFAKFDAYDNDGGKASSMPRLVITDEMLEVLTSTH